MRRLTTVNLLNRRAVAALFGSITLASIGVTSASAQMTDADVYEHIIKSQDEKRAGEIADIMARPSNWHPGEIQAMAITAELHGIKRVVVITVT